MRSVLFGCQKTRHNTSSSRKIQQQSGKEKSKAHINDVQRNSASFSWILSLACQEERPIYELNSVSNWKYRILFSILYKPNIMSTAKNI